MDLQMPSQRGDLDKKRELMYEHHWFCRVVTHLWLCKRYIQGKKERQDYR